MSKKRLANARKDISEQPEGPASDDRPLKIGLVTHDFESHYYGPIIESATQALRASGHEAIVQSHGGTRKGEINAWHSLMQCKCDGVILQADRLYDQDLDQLMSLYPNTILMKRTHKAFVERCISLDNYSGGAQAARHLVANGHRRVAMVTGPHTLLELVERRRGFIDALGEFNDETRLVMEIETQFSEVFGAEAMSQIIQRDEKISAVFFHSDDMAVGAIDWCRSHGIRVPQDISIVGFDNSRSSCYTTPPLTTIQQPLREIGQAAAACLINLLSKIDPGSGESVQRLFVPELIERASVARLILDNTENFYDIVPVSDREKTCLYWSAKGKTSWEISIILEISESTVVFHLRNAGQKLKTTNRTHTVAEAIRLGIISV